MTQNMQKESFARKYGNVITVGLWIAALSSHAFLLPKFLREMRKAG